MALLDSRYSPEYITGRHGCAAPVDTAVASTGPRAQGRNDMSEHNNQQPAALRIIGRVNAPLTMSLAALRAMESIETGELPMICGSGEPKGRLGRCRGVQLAEVINRAEVVVREHNDTKKMMVVAAADDGYKAVFSWQEIFNSPNGEGILILWEKDGRPLYDGDGDVDLVSAHDHLTGPRYVRQVRTVEIIMMD